MKANPPRLSPFPAPSVAMPPVVPPAAVRAWVAALLPALFAAGCATAPPPPPPAAPPAPIAPAPRPIARAPEPQDWRDAPIAPGEWHWAREGDTSVARFGEARQAPTLLLRCDRAAGQVTVLLPASQPASTPASAPVSMTIITSTLTRQLTANPATYPTANAGTPASPFALSLSLAAHDPLLDAMVFSRGRWRIEAEGLPPLTVPSWPEVARIIEDCR